MQSRYKYSNTNSIRDKLARINNQLDDIKNTIEDLNRSLDFDKAKRGFNNNLTLDTSNKHYEQNTVRYSAEPRTIHTMYCYCDGCTQLRNLE